MLNRIFRAGRIGLLFALIVCFAGCTSVPMPKGNSKGYSTVRFVAPNKPLAEDNTPQFIEGHRMIKASIVDQMTKNGLQVIDQNADLIVAYLVVLQDNVMTSYSNQYYGYQDFMKIVDAAFKDRLKKNYPENIQKRYLVIDLIDANTYKLVYRDYAVTGPLSNVSQEDRQRAIDNVVDRILSKFFAK